MFLWLAQCFLHVHTGLVQYSAQINISRSVDITQLQEEVSQSNYSSVISLLMLLYKQSN